MSADRTTDAYDQMLDQDALYRGDVMWQAEIGEHEFSTALNGDGPNE